jgi:hypothetical protein
VIARPLNIALHLAVVGFFGLSLIDALSADGRLPGRAIKEFTVHQQREGYKGSVEIVGESAKPLTFRVSQFNAPPFPIGSKLTVIVSPIFGRVQPIIDGAVRREPMAYYGPFLFFLFYIFSLWMHKALKARGLRTTNPT